jgi:hypothetical protein
VAVLPHADRNGHRDGVDREPVLPNKAQKWVFAALQYALGRRRAHAISTRYHKPGTRKRRVIAMNAEFNASNPQHCPSRSWPYRRTGKPHPSKNPPRDN